MKYRELPALGRPCSRLVLGTMVFQLARRDDWFALLDAYVEAGGNCLDTAFSYHWGETERVIGLWLAARGVREKMILMTKGCHPKADGVSRVSPAEIEKDLHASLEGLRVDSVDLYVLHRDDPRVPVGELIDCLNEHQRAGKFRAFGASNWSAERLEEANAYARAKGLSGFSLSSPNLSLAVPREPRWPGCLSLGTADLAWYEASQMPLFSWSSQAGGFFTGRFSPEKRENEHMVRVYYTEENWRRYDRAEALGRAKGVDANAIALAYVLHQAFPTFAIIGPVTKAELLTSLPAVDVELEPEEVHWLDGRSQAAPAALGA